MRCLLPVWGDKYLRRFLTFGLPSWLAPGNIPALAAAVPTEFVFLTSRDHEPFLTSHPGYDRLAAACRTSIHCIDHLITGTNHSATITLAYLEAVRATGEEILDTCFFFLVSDYVVADGSFRNALRRIEQGASGVQVGNFQVSEDTAVPWLEQQLGRSPWTLSLSARGLMRWGLAHLHPATIANTVNSGLGHNAHTNRLFWSVDSQTLIGRFYLMHMICIRPELRDFTIAASCDYSFIPEMCPSGEVDIIDDSDEYLVVEMQPRTHEANFLRAGPLLAKALARTLSEWTTAQHRKNAETALLFHAGDVPAHLAEVTAQADSFMGEVNAAISKTPRPHRGHPYWTGSIAAQKEASGIPLNRDEWRLVLGLPNPELIGNRLPAWSVEALRFMLFGRPPQVRQWHPRWPDYRQVTCRLQALRKDGDRLLLLSDRPTVFTVGLADGGECVVRMRISEIMRRPATALAPLDGRFHLCLIELDESSLSRIDGLLDRVGPMLAAGGRVLVSLLDNRLAARGGGLGEALAREAGRFVRPYVIDTRYCVVTASALRARSLAWQVRLARSIWHRPRSVVIAMVLFAPAALVANVVENRRAQTVGGLNSVRPISSVLVELSIDGLAAKAARPQLPDGSREAVGAVDERIGQPPDLVALLFPRGAAGGTAISSRFQTNHAGRVR